MTFDYDTLNRKAEETCVLLVQRIQEGQVVETLWSAYEQICRDVLARFRVRPRKLTPTHRKGVSFEILCFSAFIVMGQEAPKFILRKRFLLGNQPDVKAIRYFNTKLMEHLDSYFSREGLGALREVVITAATPDIQFGDGEPLNCAKRIQSYLRSGSSIKGAELFGENLALSLDPQNYAVLKILGMKGVEFVVGLVRAVLSAVFSRKEMNSAIYAGSRISKFFGFVSFLSLVFAVIALIRLQWGVVVTGLVAFLAAAYVGYRAGGGRRNPALSPLDTELRPQWNPEQVVMFELLERKHGNDYEAMINELYFGFAQASRGKVMALDVELADALEDAKRSPSAETWQRLKIAMHDSLSK